MGRRASDRPQAGNDDDLDRLAIAAPWLLSRSDNPKDAERSITPLGSLRWAGADPRPSNMRPISQCYGFLWAVCGFDI